MEQVFAPWRIEWVEREEKGSDVDCVFCALPDRDSDRENNVVARSEHAFVLQNNYPYSPGHVMVIPHVHTGELAALDDATMLDHARLKARTIAALETALDPDGFNTGMNLGGGPAGGSIPDHLHTHVVPRWQGDTNFMPVVGDTQVIVEALDDTYDRLRAAFSEQDGAATDGEDDAVELDLE